MSILATLMIMKKSYKIIGPFLPLMKGQNKADWCCLVLMTRKIIENKARAGPMVGHS
jgi:hypothetical protein